MAQCHSYMKNPDAVQALNARPGGEELKPSLPGPNFDT
ncbi:hypothetical protein NBRC3257_1158 [Gluconobacter thailandicus NBRC 3257]|uniref:Uncharacterized protein n=1 Tax=Gluconobacter thailandicus NBRC 3257 TaxID=1381097 RepID=A0ABQ0IVC4_GLUTH|nr:hypothetical protein NBRC3255_0259 [Gluconobacter thailandicus NBRC 3255]GAD26159.1 hypothetical protein NBRC3257_1158 [Gluconobacter thailandicus NBRC 3257]